jgi:hypothetical protein
MMESIRVNPKAPLGTLNEMSRINFAKLYTVEHNVKVLEFGDVHVNFVLTLLKQWRYVYRKDIDGIVDASYVIPPKTLNLY